MKKTFVSVLTIMAFALIVGAGNSSAAPVKEKLNAQLHSATIEVADCL